MDPLSVAMWRLLVGGAALLGYLGLRGHLHLSLWTRSMWARAALTGGFTALFEVTFFTAIGLSSVGLTTLIAIGSAPAWVALYDWAVSGRTPRTRTLVALVMALVGLGLLLGGSVEGGRHTLGGALLALVTGPPFVATIVTLLEPLIAAVLGWLVFSEVLGAPGIVGGAILGAGVVLLRPQRDTRARGRRRPTMGD